MLKRALFDLFAKSPLLLAVQNRNEPDQASPVSQENPVPVLVVGGSVGEGGGPALDTASAREATQQEVLAHMKAANGNSYVLASQANGEGVRVHVIAPELVSVSRQTLALTTNAQGLTVPSNAQAARISVRGGSASVATAAPPPTATEGDLWADGSMWELSKAELAGFRAVGVGGASVLHVTYLGVTE